MGWKKRLRRKAAGPTGPSRNREGRGEGGAGSGVKGEEEVQRRQTCVAIRKGDIKAKAARRRAEAAGALKHVLIQDSSCCSLRWRPGEARPPEQVSVCFCPVRLPLLNYHKLPVWLSPGGSFRLCLCSAETFMTFMTLMTD